MLPDALTKVDAKCILRAVRYWPATCNFGGYHTGTHSRDGIAVCGNLGREHESSSTWRL